jgi:uncharacterized protein
LPPRLDEKQLRHKLLTTGFRQLLLVVTDACNLNCKYCVFSDHYPYRHDRPKKIMDIDLALAATDVYLNQATRIRRRNPAHPIAVTFYGGEPLLNYPVIEAVIKHVLSRGITDTIFSISTNGTLLNENIADFLVEHNVSIAVSVDGPEITHDTNRVFKDGTGSFELTLRNIDKLLSRHPDYPYLIFLVTYDNGTNLQEVRDFFRSHDRFQKRLMVFSQVSPHFTNYYSRFAPEQSLAFSQAANAIKSDMFREGARYGHNDAMLDFLFGLPLYLCQSRRILGNSGRPGIPSTSTCLPGEKLCVVPTGAIEVCEKAPGLRIGTVETGLDFGLIKETIDSYNHTITSNCATCPITRLCGTCFATFWSGSAFRFPSPKFCHARTSSATSVLEDLYSLLEVNPSYFSDSRTIDERLFPRLKALTY